MHCSSSAGERKVCEVRYPNGPETPSAPRRSARASSLEKETPDLRRQNLKLAKEREVVGIERIYALNAVDPHCGDNLQVEYVVAGHQSPAKEAQQSCTVWIGTGNT